METAAQRLFSEQQLFKKLSNGNEPAFENAYHYYSVRLFPFLDCLVGLPELTDEIVAEVFTLLWANRERLETFQQPSTYLFNLTSNTALTYQRRIANDKYLLAQVMEHFKAGANDSQDEAEKTVVIIALRYLFKQLIYGTATYAELKNYFLMVQKNEYTSELNEYMLAQLKSDDEIDEVDYSRLRKVYKTIIL